MKVDSGKFGPTVHFTLYTVHLVNSRSVAVDFAEPGGEGMLIVDS